MLLFISDPISFCKFN